VPSGKTGLGQSSLTGLGSELAQNPDSNAVPSRRSVWSFRQRSGGSRSYLLHCRVPAIKAIVARDATIRADLQDALEVSFHDSAPLDSWRRFPNFTDPVLARCCSRVLLELQALSCAGMTLFAVLWPAFGQQNSRIRVSFLLSHVDSRTYSFAHGISH
jgi:hypothetical protein